LIGTRKGHARKTSLPAIGANETKAHVRSDAVVVLAAILVIAGIIALFQRSILAGAALIIIGLLIGPGGVSIFK
jgi:divalent metal cation (Fe/Co/Zn/Cd) transporter